ncbi:kinase-like domain-containing protein, partial [Jimgerdemannia flammicorona]
MSTATHPWIQDAVRNGLIRFIPHSDLSDIMPLTRGTFGTIQVASWRRSKVVLKRLAISESVDMEQIVKEVQFMRRTDGNNNVIQLHGVSETPDTREFIIVMQYAENGSLRDYLRVHFSALDWPAKINLAIQITRGLEFIHLENIAHRDLHNKNILMDSDGRPLIADFGIAKKVDPAVLNSSMVLTMPQYVPPERYTAHPALRVNHHQKEDIYALGFILWELSSGRAPWENHDSLMIMRKVCDGVREEAVAGTPVQYVRLYRRCWTQDPKERPSASEVLDSLTSMSLKPVVVKFAELATPEIELASLSISSIAADNEKAIEFLIKPDEADVDEFFESPPSDIGTPERYHVQIESEWGDDPSQPPSPQPFAYVSNTPSFGRDYSWPAGVGTSQSPPPQPYAYVPNTPNFDRDFGHSRPGVGLSQPPPPSPP